MTETQSTPGTGQGGGQLPPITNPYTTIAGDTLPSIAERAGHSGEWLELALANVDQVDIADVSDLVKATIVADRSQYAGVVLMLPLNWVPQDDEPPATWTAPSSSMSAADLIALAGEASTLAELDAIDAAAAGRVTVTDAVYARRETLLGQGATA